MPCPRPGRSLRAALLGALPCALLGCGPAQEAPQASARPGPSEAETAELREQLNAERARTAELEAQLRWTQDQLSQLAAAASEPDAPPGAEAKEPGAAAPGERWFDAEALAAHGLPEHRVERVERAFQDARMSELELEHEARRGGWLGKTRYRKAQAALQAALRADLGDEDYDVLLFATGKPNRVAVTNVIPNSPAARAGLEAGDIIVRYDDAPIFHGRRLRREVVQGDVGESVSIDIVRGGEPLRLGIARGPLGIGFEPRRVWPQRLR